MQMSCVRDMKNGRKRIEIVMYEYRIVIICCAVRFLWGNLCDLIETENEDEDLSVNFKSCL